MVKISIVMPVYNESDLLEKSILSVAKQTLDDFEFIFVNDGSTDDSLNVLNNLSEKHDFIKVFSQENQGSGKARNLGMSKASGVYIAFLDADDFYIDDNALEKLYGVAVENNADLVTGNIKLLNKEGKFSPFAHLEYYADYKEILPEEYGIPWSFYKSIYKKEFLDENNILFPDLFKGQDSVFLAEVLSKVDKIYAVPADVYANLYINDAKQCNTFKKRHDYIMHYKMVFDYLSDSKFIEIRHSLRHQMMGFIDMMGVKGATDTLKSIQDVFRDNPKVLRDCEEYFYFKYKNTEGLNNLVRWDKNPDKPRISVIIPVYNAEKFLDESIGGLLNQTFDDFELICVNDGSKDNSLEILNDFASRDARVIVIDKENGGCGSARNRALDEARGEYIYFFDPDDKVPKNTFEEAYKNAISNDSDVVVFKAGTFNDDGKAKKLFFNYKKFLKVNKFNHFTFNWHDEKTIVLNKGYAPWSKLYKKELLDSYDDFRFDIGIAFDDVPFHVKTMLRACHISYVNKILYWYRVDNSDSVNNTSSNGYDIFKIMDIVEGILKHENCFDDFKLEFDMFVIHHSTLYIENTGTDKYFNLTKDKLSQIDENSVLNMPESYINKYNLVMESNTLNEYVSKKEIIQLKKENKKLEKKVKKLEKENKRLEKKFNELINSNSWKLTYNLRKLRKKI